MGPKRGSGEKVPGGCRRPSEPRYPSPAIFRNLKVVVQPCLSNRPSSSYDWSVTPSLLS